MNKGIIIGDVAEFFGISKQTLIYYDKKHILKPSMVAENGYRYYTFSDVDKLDLILTLKESGLSLEGIVNYLDNRSSQTCLAMLNQQQLALENKIKELESTLRTLKKRTDFVEDNSKCEPFDGFKIVTIEERYFYEFYTFESNSDDEFPLAMKKFKQLMIDEPSLMGYTSTKLVTTLDFHSILVNDYNNLEGVGSFINKHIPGKTRVLESQTYLSYQHKGPYETMMDSYVIIMAYVATHGYEVTGPCYEIPITNVWTVKELKDYLTEIQIPIKKLLD